MAGSYRLNFDTKANVWQEIPLPFAAFEATSFGRVISSVSPMNPAKIRSVGFTISDKQEGPFKLEVDWIRAVKKSSESVVETDSAKAGCATCIFHMKGVEGC